MKEITVAAIPENLQEVLASIIPELEAAGCPMKKQLQIELAVEEIFVNIAHYAYQPNIGLVTIRYEIGGNPLQAVLQFIDSGKPYNPLLQKDPDISLSAKDREIGGLGIYLAKKSMDHIEYQYQDGKNILSISKNVGS